MAFLQSSSTVLTTNHRIISPSPSPSPSRWRRRFMVSCEKAIDRRNMLLGMGGLYSAANLKPAHADPIPPPDFTTCQPSTITKQGVPPLTVNCCPPLPPSTLFPVYTDYILPPVQRTRVRRPAHKLTSQQINNYKNALQIMRDLDTKDPNNPLGFKQQAMIHCAYCDAAYPEGKYPGIDISAHYSWLFFPFHRWYVYFYERILGSLIGDPTFALPYWNWDNPDGMQMPSIFNDPNSPLFDAKRNQAHLPPATVDLTLGLPGVKVTAQDQVDRNLAEIYSEMIGSPVYTTDFMGHPYRAGDPIPPAAWGGTVDRGSHISVHRWVGDPREPFNEDMGNFYSSGNDPLFYSLHSNVDRMWTIWKTLPTPVSKDIKDPDYLNSSFLFYDENKKLVRVKVSDCLDPAKMGFSYEYSPIPWVNCRPPKKAVRAKIQNLSKRAQTADKVFPLTLNEITKVLVPKTTKGKADEVLVLEDIATDPTKLIKFNVFVDDEDDDSLKVNRAEYAGTFAQLAQQIHGHSNKKTKMPPSAVTGSFNLSLKELYENIDIDDDDTDVVVTLYPLYNGQDVTIGGIKIVKAQRD